MLGDLWEVKCILRPIFEGKTGHLYEIQAKKSRYLEIATFPKGSFSFVAPEHYHIHNNFQPGFFSEKVGLYLCANKASLQVDPINWDVMTRDLTVWSQQNAKCSAIICNSSYQKFAQRITPTHRFRSFNTKTNIEFHSSNNFYHYYDFSFPPEDESNSMKPYVPDASHLELLSRINQHDRLAGSLGIVPNHLIQLLRVTNPNSVNKIVNDLRFSTFWSTYNLWIKRQSLNRTYWKIVPECCKLQETFKKNKTAEKKVKRKRRSKKIILEDCQNPFHYLLLKKNLQSLHGTCDCAAQCSRPHKSQKLEIKNLFDAHYDICQQQKPQTRNDIPHEDLNGLDYKHNPSNSIPKSDIRYSLHIKTSADIAREEQDRKKRFKSS